MKKIILSAVAVFAFGYANAQDKSGTDTTMSFGVKGGLNVSTLYNDDDANSLVGFHVGGFAEFMLSDKFAIQPEVLFSAQGAKYDSGNGDVKLNYINVPVMVKYYITDVFSIEAGPQVGFLVTAEDNEVDIKDFSNSVDFSVDFGAGYNLNENMVLGLRFCIGLADIEKDLPSEIDGTKNLVGQLSFGYKF